MVKTTKRTLRKYSMEEARTAKDYSKRGFKSQARDERRHSKFFRKKAR